MGYSTRQAGAKTGGEDKKKINARKGKLEVCDLPFSHAQDVSARRLLSRAYNFLSLCAPSTSHLGLDRTTKTSALLGIRQVVVCNIKALRANSGLDMAIGQFHRL